MHSTFKEGSQAAKVIVGKRGVCIAQIKWSPRLLSYILCLLASVVGTKLENCVNEKYRT